MNLDAFNRELDRFSASASESDDALLENECMQLFGRVDFILQKLDESGSQRSEINSIEMGREVLVEVLEFLSNQRGADGLTQDLPRVCAVRDQLKRYEKELKGWPIARILGWTPSRQVHEDEFIRLGRELRTLCSDLLLSIQPLFNESQRSDRILDCCDALMNNLERLW